MTTVPHVSQIFIYPIKSLDGVGIQSAEVLSSGALKGDRQFALFDQAGQFVNGKRHAKIHALRAEFDLAANTVSFQNSDTAANRNISPSIFPLEPEQEDLEAWLSEYFGFPVYLRQNLEMGFPDDTQSPGPTIYGETEPQQRGDDHAGGDRHLVSRLNPRLNRRGSSRPLPHQS